MNPFRRREEARKRRELERRQSRREGVSAGLREGSEEDQEAPKREQRGARTPQSSVKKPRAERPKAGQAKAPARPRRRGDRAGEAPLGRRAVALLAAARAAFAKGAQATARRAGAARPFLERGGSAVGRGLRIAAVAVLRVAALIERVLRGSIGFVARVLSASVSRLSRLSTPERAAFAVTVAAAACLIVSQFVDYRGVEIDQAASADVANIGEPPQRDVQTAGEAHAYLLIPVALIAVGLAAMALRSRRWQLGRLA